MKLLYISIGGGLGALSRYFIALCFTPSATVFPFTTLFINLVGSFLLGFLTFHFKHVSTHLFSAVTVGFLGGFTTFSAFSFEVFTLLQANQMGYAGIYLVVTLTFGIVCALLGMLLSAKFKNEVLI